MFHVASKNSQSEAIKPTRRCLSQNLLHSLSIFVAVHDLFHMNVKLQKYIIPFAFVHIHIIYIHRTSERIRNYNSPAVRV